MSEFAPLSNLSHSPQTTARVAPWNRFDRDALDDRVRRRLYTEGRSQIVVCEISSEDFPAVHIHPVDQVTTVLRGRVEILLDGKRHPCAAGRPGRLVQLVS